jgi:hypothetical protein
LEDYLHAVDALTISSEHRLKKQLAQQQEKHSEEYEDIRRMCRTTEEHYIQLRKELNERVRPHGIKFVGNRMVDLKTGQPFE